MSSENKKYRSSLMIIGLILEELIKKQNEGLTKADIYSIIGVKTPIGEKYINQLLTADYIILDKQKWGDLRERHIIKITDKGLKRYEWIIQLTNELKGN